MTAEQAGQADHPGGQAGARPVLRRVSPESVKYVNSASGHCLSEGRTVGDQQPPEDCSWTGTNAHVEQRARAHTARTGHATRMYPARYPVIEFYARGGGWWNTEPDPDELELLAAAGRPVRLSHLRLAAGYTVQQAAMAMGLDDSAVIAIEAADLADLGAGQVLAYLAAIGGTSSPAARPGRPAQARFGDLTFTLH